MKSQKKYFLFVVAAICLVSVAAFSYVGLPKPFIYEQNTSPTPEIKTFAALSTTGDDYQTPNDNVQTQISVEPTPLPSTTAASAPSGDERPRRVNDAKFSPLTLRAAAENSILRYNLGWFFGGKSQRGWLLYVPLIQQTIGASKDADTPEFANAVADWQQQVGLLPITGRLDDKTLYKVVEYWQSRRLNNSDYPSPDKLLVGPTSDFYDPGRETELRKVERETYGAYKQMVAAAIKDKTLNLRASTSSELAPDEKYLKIVSAFRSREYQAKLRRESPGSGRAGLAVNSPHFTGRALDIYVGGEPTITKDFNRAVQVQTPVYKWLVRNAERFGFYPYYYEPWHWEYIPERLRKPTSPAK
jgi:hypothetical protein